MDIEYPTFGTIIVEGKAHDHDVVIEEGRVKALNKRPSKPLKGQYGHTPLTVDEVIPWSKPRLVIGSGYSGRLPVASAIEEEAAERGVELVVLPTAEAVGLLIDVDPSEVNAILHVTC
jgi:hypothetical protein